MMKARLVVFALCVGCGSVQGSGDEPDAAGQAGLAITAVVDAIDIRVQSSVSVVFDITRSGAFTGDVTVELSTASSEIVADPVVVPAGEAGGMINIEVADALAGATERLTLTASGAAVASATFDIDAFIVGAAGTADESFGTLGKVVLTTPNQSVVRDSARQADGKLLLCGDVAGKIFVARYAETGELDQTFGTNGVTTLDFSGLGIPTVSASGYVGILSTGQIVVAGSGDADPDPDVADRAIAVGRLDPDGNPDGTFGSNGLIVHTLGTDSPDVRGLTMAGGDKFVLGGNISIGGASDTQFALVRLNSDGSLDPTFDGDGVRVDNGAANDLIRDTVVRANGSLVSLGSSFVTGGLSASLFLRGYQANGTPDAGFGVDGESAITVPNNVVGLGSIRLVDGAIVGGGSVGALFQGKPSIMRFDASGVFDPSFDEDGHAELPISTDQFGSFSDVVEVAAGLLLVGTIGPQFAADTLVVALFNQDGALVSAFGENGVGVLLHGETTFSTQAVFETDHSRVIIIGQGTAAAGGFQSTMFRFWI